MSVACGNKVHSPEALEAFGVRQHHHETVAQVKLCFAGRSVLSIEEQGLLDQQEQESRSELAAEKTNERFFEERGGGTYAGSPEEAQDRWLDSLNWEQAVATEQPSQQPEEPAYPYRSVGNSPNYLLPSGWKDGVYTIETESGHRTFRFRTQESESTFKPGVQIVSFLSGPSNDFARGDYTQFGEVQRGGTTKVWVKHQKNKDLERDFLAFLANPAAALAAVYCFRCHALLTVPESVESGWGPECRKMGLR